MLRGMKDTALAEAQANESRKAHKHLINALKSSTADDKLPDAVPSDAPVHKTKVKKVNGGGFNISYEHWKATYHNLYKGDMLKHKLVQDAMRDELDYFNKHMWEIDMIEHAKTVPDYIVIRSRWVLSNKGDEEHADVRARLAGCQVNKGGEKNHAFYASTPELEAKRMLWSQFASTGNPRETSEAFIFFT